MFTLRQMTNRIFRPIPLISWALASVLAGISGPFQTSMALEQPYLTIYWAVISAGSILLGLGTVQTFDSREILSDTRLRALLIAVVFSTMNCAFILLTNRIALPLHYSKAPPVWSLFLISSAIILFVIVVKYYLVERPKPSDEPKFLKRLKPELGQNLIRLCGQDHYVEVNTDKGKDMILMRFSDALEELAGFGGLQVHRSHWVSLAAIDRVEKAGSKLKIRMNDGSEVPVSRSYNSTVKDAGLI